MEDLLVWLKHKGSTVRDFGSHPCSKPHLNLWFELSMSGLKLSVIRFSCA